MKRSLRGNLFFGILMVGIIVLFCSAQNAWAIRALEKAKAKSIRDVNAKLSRVNDRIPRHHLPAGMSSMSSSALIDPVEAAITQVNSEYGSADTEFVLKYVDTDHLGYKHVRLNQLYKGVPVIGGEIIVHIDANNQIFSRTGKAALGLNISVTPGITAEDSLAAAEADPGFPVTGLVTEGPDVVIFGGVLVYEFMIKQDDEPDHWHYFVNANTGEVIQSFNDIKYDTPDQANGAAVSVEGNLLAGETGAHVTMMGWQNTGGPYFLNNFDRHWGVFDLVTNDWEQMATPDWGLTDSAAVSCGYNLDIVQDYTTNVLGFDSFDNAGAFAQCNVHEGIDFVNAYWDGADFHIGDGDGIEADSLAVLDIVGHEYGHAVTQYTSNLIYSYESGALNESFSDILGTLVEYYAQPDGRTDYPSSTPGMADWLCGEDSWLSSEALRDLRDPQRYGQPSRHGGTNWYWGDLDNGGVHTNSGVQNFAFYLLAEGGSGDNDGVPYGPVTGIGIQAAGEIAMYANMYLLTPTADYWDAKNAWISAADTLDYDSSVVLDVWNSLGVTGNSRLEIVDNPQQIARINKPYNSTVTATGGSVPYIWSIESGALPAGLTLDPDTGEISGVPTNVGSNEFWVQVDDGIQVAQKQFFIQVMTEDVWGIGDGTAGYSITSDVYGNIYVAGYLYNGADNDFYVTKFDVSGSQVWSDVYDTGSNDFAEAIAIDSLGNVYVTGSSVGTYGDCLTVKYDTNGNVQWARMYGGIRDDRCTAVVVDNNDDVYVGGYAEDAYNTVSGYDLILIKYDSLGSELWIKPYHRSLHDYAYDLTQDSQGNLYLAGEIFQQGAINYDYYLVKVDSEGNFLWDEIYESGRDEYGRGAAVDAQGNIYVTGYTEELRDNHRYYTWLSVKYRSDRTVEWTSEYGDYISGASVKAQDITVDHEGSIYVTGRTYDQYGQYGYIGLTMKYDPNGNEMWRREFTEASSHLYGITLDNSGYVYTTGRVLTQGGDYNLIVLKYQQIYPLSVVTPSLDYGIAGNSYSGILDGDGGAPPYTWSIASGSLPDGLELDSDTGEISGTPVRRGDYDFTVALTDNAGTTVNKDFTITIYAAPAVDWVDLYNNTNESAYDVVTDGDGNAYITGYMHNGSDHDYITIKYLPDGQRAWAVSYDSGGVDDAKGIAIDTGGNIYVTGTANGDCATVKYDPSGSELNSIIYQGAACDDIALDQSGNIYLAGTFYDSVTYEDYLIVKYDSNGTLQWDVTFDGMDYSIDYGVPTRDFARGIAVDSSGNVYVTGENRFYLDFSYYSNYMTVSYDPSGNLLWHKIYAMASGLGGSAMDYATSIAVDNDGHLFIAGRVVSYFNSPSVREQCAIIEYDAYDPKWSGHEIFDLGTDTSCEDISVDIDGTVYVTGRKGIVTERDLFVRRYLPSHELNDTYWRGNEAYSYYTRMDMLWEAMYDSGNEDAGAGVMPDTLGNVYVAGYSNYGTDNDILLIKYSSLSIKTESLPDGFVGSTYSGTLEASGGVQPFTWSLLSGSLPDGLSLDPGTGEIAGTPVMTGSFDFSVQVTDSRSVTAAGQLSITINEPLVIQPKSWWVVPVNELANWAHTITGGLPPYNYGISAGALPTGMSLDPVTGEISGTPLDLGWFDYTLQVTDSLSNAATESFTFYVYQTLNIDTISLDDGSVNTPYSQTVIASGGTPPYTWSWASMDFPPGLFINGATGELSGTPSESGTFYVTVFVFDSHYGTDSQSFTIHIYDPLVITTDTLPWGTTGSAYEQTLSATGGLAPYAWTVSSGTLHAGLMLDGETGVISGVPTQAGSYTFTIGVSDTIGSYTENEFVIDIYNPLSIGAWYFPNGALRIPYNTEISVTGGNPPYTWNITGGALPQGIVLDTEGGILSGTPTETGIFPITVTVTDENGSTDSADFMVGIFEELAVAQNLLQYDSGSHDFATGVEADDLGNVFVAGYEYNGTNYDYVLIKYDELGNEVWKSTYDSGNYDYARGITLDSNGNIYLTGSSNDGTNENATTVKYDPDGSIVWQVSYDNGGGEYGQGVAVDPAGNVYVGGGEQNDFMTIKYDASGTLVWKRKYDRGYEAVRDIAVDGAGNVYVTGESYLDTITDYLTVKYDADGNEVWVQIYSGTSNDEEAAIGIALDDAGNVYVTGTLWGDTSYDYVTIKYDNDGNEQWVQRTDMGSHDYARGIAVDSEGSIYVTGYGHNGINYDYYTVKYNSSGEIAWMQRYDGGISEYSRDIAVNGMGYVYVTGTYHNGTDNDMLTVRYAQLAAPTLLTGSLAGIEGMSFDQALTVSDGLAPFTWQIVSGSLPTGLTLEGSTGHITGIPAETGSFIVSVKVTDANLSTDTKNVTISIYDPLVITTSSLSSAILGTGYSHTLAATGGLAPYSWTVYSGSLPDGLVLNSATGEISGTPTGVGTFTFTVEVSDAISGAATQELTVIVDYPDVDEDGYKSDVDCNDNDNSIYPGAPEVKHDGIDQDCNGYDLTIDITRAEYDAYRNRLTVRATSDYGAYADLQVDSYGLMNWNSYRNRWELRIYNVSSIPDTVTVSGPEGSVTTTVTSN